MTSRQHRLVGTILGTAVGDAIGLPAEGLPRRRVRRLFRPPLGHRLVFGRGMTSDDTEHTCMAAQALIASGGDPQRFGRSLAWRFRWWLLALPAGVGKATARAVLKLWLGFPPTRSGVRSAGNGPAMRAAVLGVYVGTLNPTRLVELVRVSTRLTHTDPRAEQGAIVIAAAAAYGTERLPSQIKPDELQPFLRGYVTDEILAQLIQIACNAAHRNATADELTAELGLSRGVSGFIYHTVPVAIFCWLRWPGEFRSAVEAAVLAGGDTDTTAAIVGALVGATAGTDPIPPDWLNRLTEWPRSVAWMRRLGVRLGAAGEGERVRPLPLFWPGLIVRNAVFLAVVLLHGFRRLFPPY